MSNVTFQLHSLIPFVLSIKIYIHISSEIILHYIFFLLHPRAVLCYVVLLNIFTLVCFYLITCLPGCIHLNWIFLYRVFFSAYEMYCIVITSNNIYCKIVGWTERNYVCTYTLKWKYNTWIDKNLTIMLLYKKVNNFFLNIGPMVGRGIGRGTRYVFEHAH